MAKKRSIHGNIVAQNRKARHNYAIEETIEAGIMLQGSEVKSLRKGQCSLSEAYAGEKNGELFLINAHIPEYAPASRFSHEPRATRKLLLNKREIAHLLGAIQRQGMTIVPLSVYFNSRGIAKVELGLAKGKDRIDKRMDVKERDWKRQKARLMRDKG